ncbi:uncharacterized protein LODBEIA_P34650 [Lodderomyces beijingensis]|uniref:Uncharacterized protein n=1 Tax=Lodderomyces beijingensis TaxID=1775926 RepID=A0ABP0ZQN5_9ASCO
MWPFTSSSGSSKDDASKQEEIGKNLPPDLKDFLLKEDPETRNVKDDPSDGPYKFESAKHMKQVHRVLSKLPAKTRKEEYEFENYKGANQLDKTVAVNCAELEYNLYQCHQQHSSFFGRLNLSCGDQKDRLQNCNSLQADGLKVMHYQDCYDIPQCFAIKTFVDAAFVKNFGSLGEKSEDLDRIDQFYKDLNAAFNQVW